MDDLIEIRSTNVDQLHSVNPDAEHHSYVVELVPTSKYVFSSAWDGCVKKWDLSQTFDLKSSSGTAVTDGKIRSMLYIRTTKKEVLICGNNKGDIHIINVPDMKVIQTITGAHEKDICAMAFDRKNLRFYTAAYDNQIKMWNLKDYSEVKAIKAVPHEGIWCMALAKGILWTGESNNGNINVWNAETLQHIVTLPLEHQSYVRRMYFFSDLNIVISTSTDGSGVVWDADTREVKLRLNHGTGMQCCAMLNGMILTGGKDGFVKFWDLKTGKLVHQRKYAAYWVNCMAVTKNRAIILGGGDSKLQLWMLPSYKLSDEPVNLWTHQDVAAWLQVVGQPLLVDKFQREDITADMLCELNEIDLKDLGISTIGARKKFMFQLKTLLSKGVGPFRLGNLDELTMMAKRVSGTSASANEDNNNVVEWAST